MVRMLRQALYHSRAWQDQTASPELNMQALERHQAQLLVLEHGRVVTLAAFEQALDTA